MPPRNRMIQRNVSDMVDNEAVHATEDQLTGFGERRVVMTEQQLADYVAERGSGIQDTDAFRVMPMGLEVVAHVEEADWLKMGQQLFAADEKIAWRFGDWMNAGSFEWGAYKRLAKEYERNWRTIEDYAYICRNVHHSCRHEKLSLSHHKAVAPVYDENDRENSRARQRALLQYAADNNLSKDAFREAIARLLDGVPEQAKPALPETVVESTPIVIKPPFWQQPIQRLEKEFIKRWQTAPAEDRQAALKRLKALVRELEKMD